MDTEYKIEETCVEVPVIDLKGGENESKKLREACEKWGNFRVINHGVPKELMTEIKSLALQFFELPVEIKQRTKVALPGSGYNVGLSLDYPPYSVFAVDTPTTNCLSSFCSDLELSPYQREIIEKYYEGIHKLGTEILSRMAGVTGKEESVEAWPAHFRMNKYSITPETTDPLGLRVHTDISVITILQDDDEFNGFEIVAPSGALVPVDRLPGSFLINIGDMAEPWSNGTLNSLRHRVLCKDIGVRVSIATIIVTPSMNNEEEIVPHPNFLKGNSARKFGPIKYAEYRKLRHLAKVFCNEVLDTFALE